MEVLERVIKKANTDLTEKVAELFKENETLKEKHDSIKGRNRELIRENMKLYRQLRVRWFRRAPLCSLTTETGAFGG
jgi:predicted RNase H-like nuclease (RuvC/YqgF family)